MALVRLGSIAGALAVACALAGCPRRAPPRPAPAPTPAPTPPPAGPTDQPPAPPAAARGGAELRKGRRACPVCQASPRFPIACVLCAATGFVTSEVGQEPVMHQFLGALAQRGRRAEYEALVADADAKRLWERGDLAALAAMAHERAATPPPAPDTPGTPAQDFSGGLLAGLREDLWRRPEGPSGNAVESRYRAGVLHGPHFMSAERSGWEYVHGAEARQSTAITTGPRAGSVASEELVCGIALRLPTVGKGEPTRAQLLRWLPWEFFGVPVADLPIISGAPEPTGVRGKSTPWLMGTNQAKPEAEGGFEWGVRNGPWRLFYPDGKLLAEGSYDSGRLAGTWSFHERDGKVRFSGEFKRGYLEKVLAGGDPAEEPPKSE